MEDCTKAIKVVFGRLDGLGRRSVKADGIEIGWVSRTKSALDSSSYFWRGKIEVPDLGTRTLTADSMVDMKEFISELMNLEQVRMALRVKAEKLLKELEELRAEVEAAPVVPDAWDHLTKSERAHIRETCGSFSFAAFEANAAGQAEMRRENAKLWGDRADVVEPCWICRRISTKLGLPIVAPEPEKPALLVEMDAFLEHCDTVLEESRVVREECAKTREEVESFLKSRVTVVTKPSDLESLKHGDSFSYLDDVYTFFRVIRYGRNGGALVSVGSAQTDNTFQINVYDFEASESIEALGGCPYCGIDDGKLALCDACYELQKSDEISQHPAYEAWNE